MVAYTFAESISAIVALNDSKVPVFFQASRKIAVSAPMVTCSGLAGSATAATMAVPTSAGLPPLASEVLLKFSMRRFTSA